jgi:hypothetical protein
VKVPFTDFPEKLLREFERGFSLKNSQYTWSAPEKARGSVVLPEETRNRLKYIAAYIRFKKTMARDPRFALVTRNV